MQQMKEYGLIAHGYYNENVQYPVSVRRSHDGEKVARSAPHVSASELHRRATRLPNTTVLTPSCDENRTKSKRKEMLSHRPYYSHDHPAAATTTTTFVVPPNKTIDDIDPSLLTRERFPPLRKSSLSSTSSSSPILHTIRPHSVAGLSSTSADDSQSNTLFNSSQSLLNGSPNSKTLTQRFLWKIFHHQSKSWSRERESSSCSSCSCFPFVEFAYCTR